MGISNRLEGAEEVALEVGTAVFPPVSVTEVATAAGAAGAEVVSDLAPNACVSNETEDAAAFPNEKADLAPKAAPAVGESVTTKNGRR